MILNQILELLDKKIKRVDNQLKFQHERNETNPSAYYLQTKGLLEGRKNGLVDFKEDLLKLFEENDVQLY